MAASEGNTAVFIEGGQPLKQGTMVGLFIAVRVLINTSYRMVYPFLRSFANGLGVTLQTASLPFTGRSLAAAFGPLFAPFIDRYGRKRGMLLGVAMFTAGMGLVVIWPSYPAFFLALILANLGNQIFLPAMQAFLGDRIAFEKRGRILALTELSWSLSFLSLLPLSLVISRAGWTAPFALLFGFGLVALIVLTVKLPADQRPGSAQPRVFWHSLKKVFTHPAARLALSFGLSITLANEIVNITFGVWLADTYQLQITGLGLIAVVIGAAELTGEALTALLVDRIGKKKSVRAGVIFTSLAALLLPVLGKNLWGAMAGLFLFYLGFEFTLVSFIPLVSEVLPEARATVMAANLASNSIGRALGAQLGLLFYSLGFGANALAALAINAAAIIILSRIHIE